MSFNAIFQPKYHGRCPKRQNCLDALHHYVSQCAVKCGKKFNLEKAKINDFLKKFLKGLHSLASSEE